MVEQTGPLCAVAYTPVQNLEENKHGHEQCTTQPRGDPRRPVLFAYASSLSSNFSTWDTSVSCPVNEVVGSVSITCGIHTLIAPSGPRRKQSILHSMFATSSIHKIPVVWCHPEVARSSRPRRFARRCVDFGPGSR